MVKNGLAYSFLSCLGTLGIDVLNNAIETLMGSRNREQWIQAVVSVSDSVMQADQTEVRLFVILYTVESFSSHQMSEYDLAICFLCVMACFISTSQKPSNQPRRYLIEKLIIGIFLSIID